VRHHSDTVAGLEAEGDEAAGEQAGKPPVLAEGDGGLFADECWSLRVGCVGNRLWIGHFATHGTAGEKPGPVSASSGDHDVAVNPVAWFP
jgi:hypothetical protein